MTAQWNSSRVLLNVLWTSSFQARDRDVINNLLGLFLGSLSLSSVHPDEIRQEIVKLKSKLSTCVDDVPNFVMKCCSEIFVTALAHIFNLFF